MILFRFLYLPEITTLRVNIDFYTVKILNIGTPKKKTVFVLKWSWFLQNSNGFNYAHRMANSVDYDQTAPKGAV